MKKKLKKEGGSISSCDGASEHRRLTLAYPLQILFESPVKMMSNVETIVEQPVAFEAMLAAINDLSVEQLSKLALTGNTRLFKLINSGAVKAKKTKKVAAAAAGEDGEEKVRKASPGLDFNRAWVAYVRWLAQQRGWGSFEKTVGKKGQSSYKQVMAASVQREDGAHVFADTGKEISPSDAMSLAKHLKDSDDETWKAYVAENPQPVSQPKVKAAKVVPVLTAEEIEAQAQAKAAAAEAKKEAAKVKRQEAQAAKKAAAPAAPRKTKAKATPATVTPVPVAVAAPAPVVAALKKMPKKAAEPAWVCPPEGAGVWTFKGVEYIRDDEDRVWTKAVDADGEPSYGEWVGKFVPKTGEFDKTMSDPRDE